LSAHKQKAKERERERERERSSYSDNKKTLKTPMKQKICESGGNFFTKREKRKEAREREPPKRKHFEPKANIRLHSTTTIHWHTLGSHKSLVSISLGLLRKERRRHRAHIHTYRETTE